MPSISSANGKTTEQIRASIVRLCALWRIEEIQDQIEVAFSSRLTRSLGRTQPTLKVIRLHNDLSTILNPYLDEVICHELAHVAAAHLFGSAIKPHGEEWQTLVRLAGFEPTIRLHVDNRSSRNEPLPKYRHHCPVCHSERMARIRITRWRCKSCVTNGLSGELEIEKIA
jgi:SprT protein